MKFNELKAIAQGTPAIYSGRKYINRCRYNKPFEIDEEIIVVLIPKTVTNEDGSETPMLTKKGEPIFDKKIYLPFRGADGELYLTQTKSPLIFRLVRNLPVIKTEKDVFGNDLEYHERIEGRLRFGEDDYSYGDKTVPVTTLEEAED